MEKRGDILNQMAIIVDLIEKVNMEITSSTMVFELDTEEYYRVYNYVREKYNSKVDTPTKTFTIKLGDVDIIFNMSNVEKAQTS